MQNPPGGPPLTTRLIWRTVVGARLEELVWALVDDLGGTDMVWRAGTNSGVTAADGGRDVEASFKAVGPSGEPRSERWWFEAKGRGRTVGKSLVSEAVLNSAAFDDVDVLVMCTNSRYVNSAHDWVREWNRRGISPRVYLWDRDNLANMVRRSPLVAARALPESLNDADRLDLLLERYAKLGENPSHADLTYFWSRREVLRDHDHLLALVEMMVYSEEETELANRPWTSLIPPDLPSALQVAVRSLLLLPGRLTQDLPRPVDSRRATRASAHLLISVIHLLPASLVSRMAQNPASVAEGEMWEKLATSPDFGRVWTEAVSSPIFAQISDEMATICASDCTRVMTERTGFSPSVTTEEYFRRLGRVETPAETRLLTIINTNEECRLGIDVERDGCVVERDVVVDERFVDEVQRILAARQPKRLVPRA